MAHLCPKADAVKPRLQGMLNDARWGPLSGKIPILLAATAAHLTMFHPDILRNLWFEARDDEDLDGVGYPEIFALTAGCALFWKVSLIDNVGEHRGVGTVSHAQQAVEPLRRLAMRIREDPQVHCYTAMCEVFLVIAGGPREIEGEHVMEAVPGDAVEVFVTARQLHGQTLSDIVEDMGETARGVFLPRYSPPRNISDRGGTPRLRKGRC
jgi:hypothetical protein